MKKSGFLERSDVESSGNLLSTLLARRALSAMPRRRSRASPPGLPGAVVDHWAVLGLAPGSSAIAIKSAFRELARRFHPDKNSAANQEAATEEFKKVAAAQAVLSEPSRRSEWERLWRRVHPGAPSHSGEPPATQTETAPQEQRERRERQAAEIEARAPLPSPSRGDAARARDRRARDRGQHGTSPPYREPHLHTVPPAAPRPARPPPHSG